MNLSELRNLYGRARIDDRQVNELIGLARGLIADDEVNQSEAEYLYKWLAANRDAVDNPLVEFLFQRIQGYLDDNFLDDEEAAELFQTLKSFVGGDFELGEVLKSTSLPLCNPFPEVTFLGNRFCFTGTFGFGNRKSCEIEVAKLGGSSGALTQKTTYLVIGVYATDSWAHSSYGRKIEKAVKFRDEGLPINIINETHWVSALNNEIKGKPK